MPDLDKVERSLLPGWRPAYKLVKGRHAVEDVSEAVMKAIAKILRDQGGAPNFRGFAQAAHNHATGSLNDRDLVSVVRQLERKMSTRHGRLLAGAVLRPSVIGKEAILRGPADTRVAREFLVRLVEHGLFSRQRDYLVGKRFSTRAEAIRFEVEVLSHIGPGLNKLSKRLARRPSARGLRAPSLKRGRRLTTRQLLNEPL